MTKTATAESPDFILADERWQMGEFLSKITKDQPSTPWTFGESYDAKNGWMVVWQVGPIALVHPARWGHGFIKDLRRNNSDVELRRSRKPRWSPEKRKAFEEMLREWWQWVERVRKRRASKDVPLTVLDLANKERLAREPADSLAKFDAALANGSAAPAADVVFDDAAAQDDREYPDVEPD